MWRPVREKVSDIGVGCIDLQSNRDQGIFELSALAFNSLACSDLLSRHVNKCHSGIPPPVRGKKAAAAQQAQQAQQLAQQQQQQIQSNNAALSGGVPSNLGLPHVSTDVPCDQCLQLRYQCDLGAPCGTCTVHGGFEKILADVLAVAS